MLAAWNDEARIELCDAVGFDVASITPFDCFITASKINRDPEVWKRRVAYTKAHPDPENPSCMTDDPLAIVRAMSPLELEQLRERVPES